MRCESRAKSIYALKVNIMKLLFPGLLVVLKEKYPVAEDHEHDDHLQVSHDMQKWRERS